MQLMIATKLQPPPQLRAFTQKMIPRARTITAIHDNNQNQIDKTGQRPV
jgi:hypothetical protein